MLVHVVADGTDPSRDNMLSLAYCALRLDRRDLQWRAHFVRPERRRAHHRDMRQRIYGPRYGDYLHESAFAAVPVDKAIYNFLELLRDLRDREVVLVGAPRNPAIGFLHDAFLRTVGPMVPYRTACLRRLMMRAYPDEDARALQARLPRLTGIDIEADILALARLFRRLACDFQLCSS